MGLLRISRRPLRSPRRGFALLDLTVIATLATVLSLAVAMRLGQTTISYLDGEGDARQIALDLLKTRRNALRTGQNHFLEFAPAGDAWNCTLMRRTPEGAMPVEPTRCLHERITLSGESRCCEFDAAGRPLAAYSLEVDGPQGPQTISVAAPSGAIRVLDAQ